LTVSAVEYLTVVIPAKAGIQEDGSKLKSLDPKKKLQFFHFFSFLATVSDKTI